MGPEGKFRPWPAPTKALPAIKPPMFGAAVMIIAPIMTNPEPAPWRIYGRDCR